MYAMQATCSGSITTQLCYRRPILTALPLTSLYLVASPSRAQGGGQFFIRVYLGLGRFSFSSCLEQGTEK